MIRELKYSSRWSSDAKPIHI